MIRYLIDSTALWRLQRDRKLNEGWADDIDVGAIGSCTAQRTEFRRSARSLREFEEMSALFADLYPDVSTPKSVWRWIDSAQYRLASRGHHRALSVVDWLVCATAAHHDLVVLHDDLDFRAAGRVLPEVREHNVHDLPRG